MKLTDMARRYYKCYETGDRAFLDATLAPGFTFTSPFDDVIDRDAYFRRCWPNHEAHGRFHIEAVMEEGDIVLVVYRAEMKTGNPVHPDASFRNAERMRFEKGQLKSVEVFFGDPPSGLTRRQFTEQSGAG